MDSFIEYLNGVEIKHDNDGLIFIKEFVDERLIYYTPKDPEVLAIIKDYIIILLKNSFLRKQNKIETNTLVRISNIDKGNFSYYPLRLLFVSEDKRIKEALDRGKEPPCERWVSRKRRLVLKFLNIEEQDVIVDK